MALTALWMAQLYDLHLSRSITRLASEANMSKFLELAESIESDLQVMDAAAEALDAQRLANKVLASEVMGGHMAVQARVKEGLEKMRGVIHDMGGSNSRKFTEAELAALKAEEPAKPAEVSGEAPPVATFQKAAQ